MRAEEIATALCGKRCGKNWIARCPLHDDTRASFSIGEGNNGRILVYCHAGCTQEAVIQKLKEMNLWGNNGNKRDH